VSNAAKAMKQDAGGAVGPRKLKLWQSGPITAEASPPTFELQGGLGRDYAYAHAATREQCVATCTAAWSEFETMFTTHVITPGVEPGKPGRGVLPKPRRPEWLKQLLVFPDEALFDGEKDAVLQQYLDTELVKRDLMHMFDMVGPGHGEREAAGAVADPRPRAAALDAPHRGRRPPLELRGPVGLDGHDQGSKRERNSQLQRLLSRPVSTRFG